MDGDSHFPDENRWVAITATHLFYSNFCDSGREGRILEKG